MKHLISSLAIAVCAGCASSDLAPHATVIFSLNAPLCSSTIPAQFLVDSVQVGIDTFRVNLPPAHTSSQGFPIVTGTHRIGARLGLNGSYVPWPGVPDTLVTLSDGATFTRVLPLACS
jgi:hypothetical protein